MKLRHQGDYVHGESVTAEQGDEQITRAERFLREVERLLGGQPAS